MTKGIFGSFKDKMSKRSSWKSTSSSNSTSKMNPFRSSASSQPAPADAPPAYSAAAPANHTVGNLSVPGRSASPAASLTSSLAPSIASVTNDNDKYAFLRTFDTVFVVDDSGSMAGSNWDEVRKVLHSITPICTSRDKDGIDLYFLNHKSSKTGGGGKATGGYYNISNPRTVNSIFEDVRPTMSTPTGARLNSILKPYIAQLKNASDMEDVKPVNIIVITDGCASDDPEAVIVQHAGKLDKLEAPLYQVGIQFFQVGNNYGARDALRELDDDLASQGVRDMVDASTWDSDQGGVLTADGILKVVLGSVVRKIDRQRTSGERRRS